MRAAVLEEIGRPRPYAESKPLVVHDLELDQPGPDEVRVQIIAVGLCHSDLSVIEGNRPRPTPIVLGHEAAGTIEQCGSNVEDVKVGDHVVLTFMPACGACLPCLEGRPAICEPGWVANSAGTLLSGHRRLHGKSGPVSHYAGVAGFAEAAVVSRRSIVKIDQDLSFQHAALFGCAVLTGVGAVVNTAQVTPGKSVAIVGLGGVGLSGLLAAVLAGSEKIIAVDTSPEKLRLAKELGATHLVEAGPDAAAEVKEITHGGVHFAFEMASAAPALAAAYEMTRRGGTTVSCSLPHSEQKLSVPIVALVSEERTIRGSYLGSSVPARDLPRYISLFRQGKLPVDRLLSEVIQLDEINEGFDRLAEAKSIRQIVDFSR